jgi:hypothetical protein
MEAFDLRKKALDDEAEETKEFIVFSTQIQISPQNNNNNK